MKKSFLIFFPAFLFYSIFAQEALKSTEEEYYDFLSLQGLVERPTLGYRTLSDSEWKFAIDEDGNRVRKQGEINVETGDITAKAETGNAVSAYSYASGGVVNAETGSVTARGNGDEQASISRRVT